MLLDIYKIKRNGTTLVKQAMKSDNSWNKSAKIYLNMYRELTGQD